jgi:hypothetical protein
MAFRVGTPVYNTELKCHTLALDNGSRFQGKTVSPFHIDFTAVGLKFSEFVEEFLSKASSYFSKPLDPALFFQRVVHSYSTGEDLSGVQVKSISWIPARVLFYPTRYEIQWVIGEFEEELATAFASGELVETAVPDKKAGPRILHESAQKRIRQKIRQARLKAALARLQVEQMTEKYYAKYGGFDGFSDADSELSSDFEFNPNEPPRKI